MLQSGLDLTTRRCVLRPVTGADAPALHDLWTGAGVRRFLWDDEVIPMSRTLTVIEQSQRLFGERRYGLWAAWPTAAPSRLDGFAGLWPFREPPEIELLYGVAEPRWGNGFATEIAQAVLAYCFESLDMPVVRASTDVANIASVRVLEKLGGDFEHRRMVDGLDTVFYECRRPTSGRRAGGSAEQGREQ